MPLRAGCEQRRERSYHSVLLKLLIKFEKKFKTGQISNQGTIELIKIHRSLLSFFPPTYTSARPCRFVGSTKKTEKECENMQDLRTHFKYSTPICSLHILLTPHQFHSRFFGSY